MLAYFETLFAPLLKAVNFTTLILVSFIEAIFFPLPPDVVVIPFVLERPHQALLIATVTALASVAGAVIGYFLGLKGGRPLLRRFAPGDKLSRVEALYQKYDVGCVFISAFTPIPYKVFAIAAGVFDLSLPRFLLVSLVGRFARFALLAMLVSWYGRQVVSFIEAYFEQVTLGVAVIGLLGWWVWRRIQRARVRV